MVSRTKKGEEKRQINFKRCYNLTLKDKKVNVSSLPKKSKHNNISSSSNSSELEL